ncbi:eukaryotic translation initiation factor 3 subunit [Naegleria gruberi]|uniref:Eukaryotic translation initiation factor 3 subunit n=1 Tax=Naegleria gruberi TaxID=5762 RepID=D2UXD8_NAEGR|nr:eukaryotic translation initiation factor 3 subunit [Naegleria gruberi]EFC50268.1 eukaryotic translation initiation factor 3 subunit [Naegleria gruberi]|eukprot:XP_002683012.1 eukaryotic translation initiation factor 3 subunit [Naegleria gruberi strain NEG-M]
MAQYLTTKAENALKRTADYIQSEQLNLAFLELGAIVSKFGRQIKTWHEIYEDVAKRFIKVSVELRKAQEIKNVLSSYRILCQSSEIKSFGNVILLYLDQAEKRTQKAIEKSKSKSLTLEKDLENEIPENILLYEVSGEGLKDRTDREIVTPWMRFLWETYRLVLELLKKDPQLESIYHETCKRAFDFCLKYERKTEFKRLSDLLRAHIKGVEMSSYESIAQYLSARFFQLTVAIKLDLWQDAFKSVEDIYYLISTSKSVVIPQAELLNYYEQLTKIFWTSKNYILHAYAHYKAFAIHKSISNSSVLQTSANSLLLSTLTTPSNTSNETLPTDFISVRNERRLVSLLGLSVPPSKELLVSELDAKNVTQLVDTQLRDLYRILEVDFSPLKMCEKIKPILEYVKSKEDLAIYYEPLKQITVTKLLQQLARAFQSIKIETVSKMADFVSLIQLEKILVENANTGKIQVIIDHGKGVLVFGKSPRTFDANDVHNQIALFGKRIHDVIDMIHPERKEEKEKKRKKFIADVSKKLSPEIEQISIRNDFIRMKKLWHEQEHKRALEKVEERKVELAKQRELEEERIAQQEAKNREEEKKRRERKIAEEKKKREIIDMITNNNTKAEQDLLKVANKSLKKKLTSLIEMEMDDIIELKRSEIQREKKEKEKKLVEKSKNMDYLEITRREIEMPLFDDYNKKQQQSNKESFDSYVSKQNLELQKELTEMRQKKQELSKYFVDTTYFASEFVLKKRKEEFERLKSEQDKRKQQKKEEWETKRVAIIEEIERRRKKEEEEREIRRKEEEERKKKREQEMEEERKKKDEYDRIQRQKDEEYYQRQKEKQAEIEKRLQGQQQTPKKQDRWGGLDSESSSPFGGAKKSSGYVPPHLRRQESASDAPKEQTEQKPETNNRRFAGSDESFSAFGKKPASGTGGSSGSSGAGGRGGFGSNNNNRDGGDRWRK